MKKRQKTGPLRIAPYLKLGLICAVTYMILSGMLLVGSTPQQYDIQLDKPSPIDIYATKEVVDVVTTEENREAAAESVPLYTKEVVDSQALLSTLRDDLGQLEAWRQSGGTSTLEIDASSSGSTDSASAYEDGGSTFAMTGEHMKALLDLDGKTYTAYTSDIVRLTRETLKNSVTKGQEAPALSEIAALLAEEGYSAELVSLAQNLISSNLVYTSEVDETITEAERQKARDSVLPVTYAKNQRIVASGETVTKAKYEMLSQLGLVKGDSIDVPTYAGIALSVLIILASLAFYLGRFEPGLINPKMVTLLCLILCMVTLLCLVISQWSSYLMPVSLGIMLIALLVNQRVSLYFNIALGFIAALLTNSSRGQLTIAMFAVVMMTLISGPIALYVFSRSKQRIATLVAGLLVGIANFVVTLAVGLMNSAEIYTVLINALWAFASGLLSAILCIGFQPLLEWLFNLATNAKLIELSNPNQPLLHRLLLEAPGTYHHSIIVANLAEAACSAIGANGLLARVASYYHDVGKLKRPLYFKENQLGDNPHDRTDPRVSAAILTAHPRDGAALAQKARLPEPIIDIIRQHHGDSVPLWFYDKAVKLYGAQNVDISAFRYDGPRPRSREAAVVMLSDTIEAATRSLPNPDPDKINAMIRKLVLNAVNNGQLDESNLTFNNLETICSAFSTVLTGVFHERIEYPDINAPARDSGDSGTSAPKAPAPQEAGTAAAPAKTSPRPQPSPTQAAKPAEAQAGKNAESLPQSEAGQSAATANSSPTPGPAASVARSADAPAQAKPVQSAKPAEGLSKAAAQPARDSDASTRQGTVNPTAGTGIPQPHKAEIPQRAKPEGAPASDAPVSPAGTAEDKNPKAPEAENPPAAGAPSQEVSASPTPRVIPAKPVQASAVPGADAQQTAAQPSGSDSQSHLPKEKDGQA